MLTHTRTTLLIVAALATLAVAPQSHAAPPTVTLGPVRDMAPIVTGPSTKPGDSVSLAGIDKPKVGSGIGNMRNPADLIYDPKPSPSKEPPPGESIPPELPIWPDAPNPGPDWPGIWEGLGKLFDPPGHGGYHPGHDPWPYPGHHPGHHPGHIPGNPAPGNGGSSYVPSNPLPERPIDPGSAVVVTNPEKNGASISFVADGRRFKLAPGYQQVVRGGGSVEVRFDRGGSFGTARYKLRNGVFQFLVTDEGWNLFRKVYRVTLDNSANALPFRYLVGNKIHAVEANGTREYEEDSPLVVKFDPGTGKAATRTLDSGTYRIAINPGLQLWDLMEVDPTADVPDVASNLPPSLPLPKGM